MSVKKISKKQKETENTELELDADEIEEKINSILDSLRKNYLEQKKLEKEIRELLPLHKKQIKLATKSKKQAKSRQTGFALKNDVPQKIRDFFEIDDEPMSRTDISKLFYQYFRENNLQDQKDKRNINTNSSIRKLFGMTKQDKLTMYNFNTWLKKLYDEASDSAEDDTKLNLLFS